MIKPKLKQMLTWKNLLVQVIYIDFFLSALCRGGQPTFYLTKK